MADSPIRSAFEACASALTKIADYELESSLQERLQDLGERKEFLSQPDAFVMSNEEWRRVRAGRIVNSLLLAVEVLSPSSAGHDRVRKRPAYQRTVPEYWIVDLDARLVERWRPGDDRPEILPDRLEWLPVGASAPFRLDVAEYFARVLDEPELDDHEAARVVDR